MCLFKLLKKMNNSINNDNLFKIPTDSLECFRDPKNHEIFICKEMNKNSVRNLIETNNLKNLITFNHSLKLK